MKTMEEACRKFAAAGALTSYDGVMKHAAMCQEIFKSRAWKCRSRRG